MKVYHQDGTEVIVNKGDTYNIVPGHKPEVLGDEACIMVEFSQDPTLAKVEETLREEK